MCSIREYDYDDVERTSRAILDYSHTLDFGSLFARLMLRTQSAGECMWYGAFLIGRAIALPVFAIQSLELLCFKGCGNPFNFEEFLQSELIKHPLQFARFRVNRSVC
jgi:hypothetical protein